MPSLLFSTGEHEGSANGNSMHPCSDIRLGENLIASVYNVLRNSPIWEETLLIVTFDENGGVYDHVLPPAVCAPDSYGYYSNKKLLFDYTMLGPRIPALLISPWLEKGVVDSTQYRNTSILRFVQDLFAAQNQVAEAPSLTQRDLNANSIALSAWRATPHEHCPAFIKPHVGFANWGTEMTDPNGDDPYSGPYIHRVTKPVPPVALDFAKAYCSQYPGHPDSGKPLEQLFKSQSEMLRYMTERRHAARKFYRDHR
ncbi:alkaline phosphatase family protein [Undibacterium umbellatum]|uniref:Phosphoesterase n=1 Tax=Undibacterium umbellatum TaxID=2762300 RepID=A0ABR6ZGS9_9BURK|nr:alkaline phosphatase family protein [Undibacterium umbellatum]MBC3910939.1 hypothetical protein [Undibacterium umbellatum]